MQYICFINRLLLFEIKHLPAYKMRAVDISVLCWGNIWMYLHWTYTVQWEYLAAVPLALGNAATDAVIAHSWKVISTAARYPHASVIKRLCRREWRKLYEDLYNLYISLSIVKLMKTRRMRWSSGWEGGRSSYEIMVGSRHGKNLWRWRLTIQSSGLSFCDDDVDKNRDSLAEIDNCHLLKIHLAR
jgi:hypothetical protein